MDAYLLAGAHIGAGIDGIIPRFEHIAERRARFAGIIERRHIGARERHDHSLLLTRQKSARFFICGEALCRLAELALRRAIIDFNNLFACGRADILNFYGDYYSVVRLHDGFVGQLERSVAQTEAEREHDLFRCEGFKISVADKNVLGVVVVCPLAEVLRRRIAIIAIGNCIGQLAARRNFAGENLANGVSALHSALPDIEHRTELVAVFIHPRHIYNIAAVYQHNGVLEIRGHLVEQRGFIVGQIIAALFERVFPVLARGATYNYDGAAAALCRIGDGLFVYLHLIVIARPCAPEAVIRRVLLYPI